MLTTRFVGHIPRSRAHHDDHIPHCRTPFSELALRVKTLITSRVYSSRTLANSLVHYCSDDSISHIPRYRTHIVDCIPRPRTCIAGCVPHIRTCIADRVSCSRTSFFLHCLLCSVIIVGQISRPRTRISIIGHFPVTSARFTILSKVVCSPTCDKGASGTVVFASSVSDHAVRCVYRLESSMDVCTNFSYNLHITAVANTASGGPALGTPVGWFVAKGY